MSSDKSVGQWAGTIVGGVIGFFAGGPYGAIQGASLGAGIGGLIDPPKGPSISGPRLNDLSVQTSTFGAPLGRIHGTAAVQGNVIWLENNQIREVVRKEKQGGKGGGGGATVTTYTYFATFAVGLTDAPPGGIVGVRRVWIGSNLVYNASSDDLETIIASYNASNLLTGNNGVKFRVYSGADDQQPDSRIEAEMGVGNAPAFRGTSYIMLYDLPLDIYGNSLLGAQVKVELLTNADLSSTKLLQFYPNNALSVGDIGLIIYPDSSSGRLSRTLSPSGDTFTVYDYTTAGMRLRAPVSHEGYVSVPYRFIGAAEFAAQNFARTEAVVDGRTFEAIGYTNNYRQWEGILDGDILYCRATQAVPLAFRTIRHNGATVVANTTTPAWSIALGDDYLYAVNGTNIFALDKDTLVQIYSVGFSPVVPLGRDSTHISFQDGLIWVLPQNDGFFQAFDPVTGENVHLITDIPAPDITPTQGFYGAYINSVIIRDIFGGANPGPGVQVLLPAQQAASPVSLQSVVESELQRSGFIRAQDIDAIDLASDYVNGYRISGVQQIRSCIGPLQMAYPFDLVNDGYKIKAVRRGKSSALTIPLEKLDARLYGDAFGVQFEQTREMDSQLPRKIILRHLDANREYDTSEQLSSEKTSSNSVEVREIDLPLVLTGDEAAQVADVLFNLAWIERDAFSFRLGPEYLALQPADVITIATAYGDFPVRIGEINYLPDGRLEITSKAESSPMYTSVAVGGTGVVPDGTIGIDGESITQLMDIPLIRNQDDDYNFAAAMAGTTTGWRGGVLFRSPDSGQTWQDIQAWNSPVTLGNAGPPLSADDGLVIDRAGQLRVDMVQGELDSITESQMMAGLNWVAYGADGRWELMRFAEATLQPDGSYILSTLLRGLRGSEWATGLHEIGDAIVLLDDPDVLGILVDPSSLNVTRLWRGVTAGADIGSAADIEFAYMGVNLKPLSAVHGNAELSGADWVIAWDARTRLQGSLWKTGTALPIGESSEIYQIDILSGSTVVRTLTSTTTSVTYTEADQITDFGSPQSSVDAVVYQISSRVGRGYPLEIAA